MNSVCRPNILSDEKQVIYFTWPHLLFCNESVNLGSNNYQK